MNDPSDKPDAFVDAVTVANTSTVTTALRALA